MFNPNQLIYRGRQQGIDVFDYNGVRIDASLSRDGRGQCLCLGLGVGLPESVLPGLMAWFGLDWHREYAALRFPDRSRCFMQTTAA